MIYKNEYLNEISFPIGGIGTGSVGISGNGSFVDWEIFGRPDKGSILPFTFFAIRALLPSGESIEKILMGDVTKDLSGSYAQNKLYSGIGFGPNSGLMCGFPHFSEVVFDGRFPIATLTFRDKDFPATVTLTAYNPFIPLDDKNSSIPVAIFNINVKSSDPRIKYTVTLSAKNPFPRSENKKIDSDRYSGVTLRYAGSGPDERDYGDITIATDCKRCVCQEYWYRGGWSDAQTTFFYEFSHGELSERHYSEPGAGDVATVGAFITANEGNPSVNFTLSWNKPNCYNYWNPYKDENGNDVLWKNYYATLFSDSADSAKYTFDNLAYLYGKTRDFCEALHSSTLDPAVIDAAASTLSVLKSPTVLRLEDGRLWGWEGVHKNEGSCEGTCTHVWSYAYALCFLFPSLERSIRETEFDYDTDENGAMAFRTKLPLRINDHNHRPCLDGQMASVIKTYREWKISGNDEWLRSNFATVKKLIDYAHSDKNPDCWDRDRDGVLEGRQHHTLDMELFGPCGWLQGMYLAALSAAAKMAKHIGEDELSDEYLALFKSGYEYTRRELFNGEYFIQKIDISDKSYTERFDCKKYWNEERGELKYQIGEGCEIDQLLGQWHARIVGLDDVFDKEQRQTALFNMFKYLYKPSMRNFPNPWRIFAYGDEGGAVMCDYPKGKKRPIIPIPYESECMTGFEYAFAGLLISEGYIDEGLTVVRSIRARYDGKKRNPYNEIECGSNYARAMASFALLPIFSGFEFDMVSGHIGFSPIISGDFSCFFSLEGGWGTYKRSTECESLSLSYGSLRLSSFGTKRASRTTDVIADGKSIPFKIIGNTVHFDPISIVDSIIIK